MKKWKKLLGWLVSLCIILGIGAVFYLAYQLGFQAFANEPVGSDSEKVITIEVKEGEGVNEIADSLVEKGILEHAYSFTFRYIFSEYRGKIQPGTYEITETMGIDDILLMFSQVEDKK